MSATFLLAACVGGPAEEGGDPPSAGSSADGPSAVDIGNGEADTAADEPAADANDADAADADAADADAAAAEPEPVAEPQARDGFDEDALTAEQLADLQAAAEVVEGFYHADDGTRSRKLAAVQQGEQLEDYLLSDEYALNRTGVRGTAVGGQLVSDQRCGELDTDTDVAVASPCVSITVELSQDGEAITSPQVVYLSQHDGDWQLAYESFCQVARATSPAVECDGFDDAE